ncbi:MAG: NEW3 domain-containing protein [Mangrovibacterium sp.]
MKLKTVFIMMLVAWGFVNLNAQDRASLILDLKKAKVAYEMAKNKFENDDKLLNEKAISQMEYSKSKNELLSAEVEYQKLMLKLISEQSYIVVEKAVKYQTRTGDKRVRVTIRSSMEGNQDYLSQFKEHIDLFTPEMQSGKTYNVFVSLNHLEDKTIIGSPYEIRIPAIDLGESVDVDFGLLRDVESLQVLLSYNSKKDEKNIFLEKDASTNFIDIASTQFSQEADLGSNASYDLSLERFSSSDDVFKLLVVNLPRQVSYSFEDTETGARLSNLKFNQGINLRKLSLKTYLPERDDEKVVIDRPIIFYALVVVGEGDEQFEKDPYQVYEEKELNEIQGGKIRLELIPRGIGKLEVRATNLYHEITVGDEIRMDITVKNYGTRRIDNIKVGTDNPLNWVSNVEPKLIRSLDPEQEEKIKIAIIPPADVSVGAQEVKIKTEAYANNRRVETDNKTIRIQVNAKANIFGTIVLIILLIGIIVGVIVFGIKISKR